MVRAENRPQQEHEHGFLKRHLRRLAKTAGGVALLGVALIVTAGTVGEMWCDFDDPLA